MFKIFVYGTLRKDGRRPICDSSTWHSKEGTVILLGKTTIPATMYSLGGFPAIELQGAGPVVGEVWEVPDDLLLPLDYYEGYPSLYVRSEIDTEYGTAWVYHQKAGYNIGHNTVVSSGDWLEYVEECRRERLAS